MQPGHFVESLTKDLRYGLRSLWRHRGVSLVIVAVLALGIGANTTIFSVVNPFLLRPLPYEDPDRLVHLFQTDAAAGWLHGRPSPPQFLDWQQQATAFSELAAYNYRTRNLSGEGGEPEQLVVGQITAGVLPLLGVAPRLGRGFEAGEDAAGAPAVAILGHGLWQRRFGGRDDAVGGTIRLDGVPHTVIGVMARGFNFPYPEVRLWTPLHLDPAAARSEQTVLPVGRLAPGVGLAAARAELETIHARLAAEHPEVDGRYGVRLEPLRQALLFAYDTVRMVLLLLLAAVGFVLLIVAANVANLLLARASARRGELAVRASLGAGRGRLIQQLLTESALLALLGGVAGVALAQLGVGALGRTLPEALYRVGEVSVDATVLAFSLGVSLLAALLCGLVPALRSARVDVTTALRQGGRGGGGRGGRTRAALVVAQIGLAVVLLSSAAAMLSSAVAMQRLDLGFTPARVLTLRLSLPAASYPGRVEREAFFRRLDETLAAVPGVERAATVFPLPLMFTTVGTDYQLPDRPPAGPDERLIANRIAASPGYFAAMGIALREGRVLRAADGAGSAPVVVVNRALAERHWPGRSAVGRTLRLLGDQQTTPATVVGVVDDVRDTSAWQREAIGAQIYQPFAQAPYGTGFAVLRSAGSPAALAPAVRAAIRQLDADLPVAEVRPMTEVVATSVTPIRLAAQMLGLFAGAALLLAAVGIYGVVAYAVARRRHELGVRMALGADRRAVVRLVLRQGVRLTAVGAGLGLLASLAVGRLVASALGGVDQPPAIAAAVALLLGAVAVLASYLPARRAARVDPIRVLRQG